jgi:hypothetical protein
METLNLIKIHIMGCYVVRLCGLVVRDPGYSGLCEMIWEAVGSLSPVSTIEELLGRSRGCGLKSRKYGRKDPLRKPHDIHYPR